MSSQYAGDPNAYPADYTIPDDADPPTAAAVNVGLEALGDRTECLRANGLVRRDTQTFTTAGAWTVWTRPLDMVDDEVEIEGYGGGGGGGCCGPVSNGTDVYGSGGAGGGAAPLYRMTVDVSSIPPGGTVNVYVGNGGAGGATAGTDGGAGETTVFDLGPPTVELPGGDGGGRGRVTTDANRLLLALGGSVLNAVQLKFWEPITGALNVVPPMHPGQGGHAGTPNTNHTFHGAFPATSNTPTNAFYGGGLKGTKGTDSGTSRGGGAGAGGGGGPGGSGGAGGNGGNGNGAGVGSSATAGASGSANSGAGGGGAGSPGHGTGGLGSSQPGGNGGSGKLIVKCWRKGVTLP